MSISINDEAMIATFSSVSTPEEIRTHDGRLLGQFIPAPRGKMTFPEFGMTDEEIEREDADLSGTWHTPEEVMARLNSLIQKES